ncbi:unnamed protein product [Brugia pahangi]|uniref:Lipoprotein n=1 Tax=Brugia pahangi TaxID=6280 RepID=A0A0N4THT7_BRUPA|nr:unnamed protein product [Brugia pahangi]
MFFIALGCYDTLLQDFGKTSFFIANRVDAVAVSNDSTF